MQLSGGQHSLDYLSDFALIMGKKKPVKKITRLKNQNSRPPTPPPALTDSGEITTLDKVKLL